MNFSDQPPDSVLARGVQITEFEDDQINPEPVPLDESDLLLRQYLSPRKLCLLGGVDDLEDISCLEVKVDTSEMSLGNFGSLVPNLTELKLSNSSIHSIRDLGSCLHNLRILWMSQCSLQDLDGIGSLSNLHELYLSFNEISEISSVSMLENLQILDLEGNNIDCFSQVPYLAFCTKLTTLTLEGNPVCVKPSPESEIEEYNYRMSVRDAIPQLQYLDDEPLSDVDCKKNVNVFNDDWAYMEKLQQDVMIQEIMMTNDEGESASQSFVSAFRPATNFKPSSALRPSSAIRPLSSRTRPQTSASYNKTFRPFSALAGVETDDFCHSPDPVSELTDGSVVCGNPSRALLSRSKLKTAPPESKKRLFPQYKFKAEHTYDTLSNDNQDLNDVLEQLQEWKIQHEKRRKQIEASWAPQVLKIEPGEYLEESEKGKDLDDDYNDDVSIRETIAPSLRAKPRSFENEPLKQELLVCKSKKQPHNYDHNEPMYSVSPPKMDVHGVNPKPCSFAKPSPPSKPPLSPPLACRSKRLKSQAVKSDQNVLHLAMNAKPPVIKEQISSYGRRPLPNSKAFPHSYSARASIAHAPPLLPSLLNLKSKSSCQKLT